MSQSRDDLELRQGTSGGDGRSSQAREVIAVGAGDAFDQAERSQAMELTRQARGAQLGHEARQVGATHAVDVELGALQCPQKPLLGAFEEVQTLDGSIALALRFAEPRQVALAAGSILDGREELQVAPIAGEQNLAQVDEAVDRLLQGSEFPSAVPITVFHLAVVLEEGDIVGGGFQPQHAAELVVHLHPGLGEAVLDAGALDAGGKAAAQFLGEQGRDLLAQEACHLLGLDCEHRLAREALIQGLQGGLGAEDQVSRVLHLHQAPVIGLPEDFGHRAEALGIPIKAAVQLIGTHGVSERLRPVDILEAHEGVIGKGIIDAGGGELSRQPRMTVAVELQAKRTPGGHPQVAKTEFLVDEVEVVVQALARVGLERGLAAGLVVPRSVALAGFHRRDYMHQPRMIASACEHLRHHVLLADVRLVDVLDLDARLGTRLLRTGADAFSQRFGKARVVKDADAPRVKKARHPARVACARERARNHDSVIAREHPHHAVPVALCQHLRHRRLPCSGRRATLPCLVPAMPA